MGLSLVAQVFAFLKGLVPDEWIKTNPIKSGLIVTLISLTLVFSPIGFSGPAAEALGIEFKLGGNNDEAIKWMKEDAITKSKYLLGRGVYQPEEAKKLLETLAIIRRDMGAEYSYSNYAQAEIMLMSKYKSTLKDEL